MRKSGSIRSWPPRATARRGRRRQARRRAGRGPGDRSGATCECWNSTAWSAAPTAAPTPWRPPASRPRSPSRTTAHVPEKRRIAAAAVELLGDAETIFIDEGFTPQLIAEALPADRPLTVVTASLSTAARAGRHRTPSPCCCSAAGYAAGTLATVDHWASADAGRLRHRPGVRRRQRHLPRARADHARPGGGRCQGPGDAGGAATGVRRACTPSSGSAASAASPRSPTSTPSSRTPRCRRRRHTATPCWARRLSASDAAPAGTPPRIDTGIHPPHWRIAVRKTPSDTSSWPLQPAIGLRAASAVPALAAAPAPGTATTRPSPC